jgi:predicted  nucleic acid-binding Zn-ribbon protein
MPAWLYLLGGIAAFISAVVSAVVVLRKLPAEAQKINVDTVDVNVNIAGRLRDQAVADWERISRELADLRKEFDTYKEDTDARLIEQAAEVRASRADARAARDGEAEAKRKADQYREENEELRTRVVQLEDEVARLKARPDSTSPRTTDSTPTPPPEENPR